MRTYIAHNINMTIEDLEKIEKKFNFLEKYLNKDIEIISDE